MKSSRIITILAGLVVAMTASAQVGILDQNAEFRKIPMGAQRDSAKLDSLNRYYTERPVAGTRRDGDKPLLFLIGDSTMRTGVEGNGDNGQCISILSCTAKQIINCPFSAIQSGIIFRFVFRDFQIRSILAGHCGNIVGCISFGKSCINRYERATQMQEFFSNSRPF